MKKYIIALSILGLLATVSCQKSSDPTPRVHRLDRVLEKGHMPEDDEKMLDGIFGYFYICGYGEPSDAGIYVFNSMPQIMPYRQAVDTTFTDFTAEAEGVERVLENFSKEVDKVNPPHAFTVINPYPEPVLVMDSLVFIGLSHYLGADSPLYSDYPDYMKARKVRERIPADVAETMARVFYQHVPETGVTPTVISEMLYEGAITEAIMQMAGVSEAFAIGMPEESVKWIDDNEARIWEKMVNEGLVTSIDPDVARGLIGYTPAARIIHPEAPGMIGKVIGHRIVKSYLEANPSVTWSKLLEPTFFENPNTLERSGYNPGKK